jgi:hypothetical protein
LVPRSHPSVLFFEYVGLFSDGSVTADADVIVTSVAGTPDLDGNSNAAFGKQSRNVVVSTGEAPSSTVDLLNASTG